MSEPRFEPGFWVCAHRHVFAWADESWHAAASQPNGAPMFCPVAVGNGGPCEDSSHLWGPYASAEVAIADHPLSVRPWGRAR